MSRKKTAFELAVADVALGQAEQRRVEARDALQKAEDEFEQARGEFLLSRGWSDVSQGGRSLFAPPPERKGTPWECGTPSSPGWIRPYRQTHLAVTLERRYMAESKV